MPFIKESNILEEDYINKSADGLTEDRETLVTHTREIKKEETSRCEKVNWVLFWCYIVFMSGTFVLLRTLTLTFH